MYSFRNDYSEGAHPKVLQALADTNLVQTVGYGTDPLCDKARDTVRRLCAAPNAEVHFLVGGETGIRTADDNAFACHSIHSLSVQLFDVRQSIFFVSTRH